MLELINNLDTQLFLFLNGLHTTSIDPVMWLASNKLTWAPMYIWFLWLLYKVYRKNFWLVLITIVVMVVISDQLCNLSKNGFMRLRPSQNPALGQLVHILKGYRGGLYGFYSGHASNSFAVAIFVILALKSHPKYIIAVSLGYALLVSYSRIYLGVHYPLDVLTGALMGSLIGLLIYKVMHAVINWKMTRDNKRVH